MLEGSSCLTESLCLHEVRFTVEEPRLTMTRDEWSVLGLLNVGSLLLSCNACRQSRSCMVAGVSVGLFDIGRQGPDVF